MQGASGGEDGLLHRLPVAVHDLRLGVVRYGPGSVQVSGIPMPGVWLVVVVELVGVHKVGPSFGIISVGGLRLSLSSDFLFNRFSRL